MGTDETSYSLVERVTSPFPTTNSRTSTDNSTTTRETPTQSILPYENLPLTWTPTIPGTKLFQNLVGHTSTQNHMVIAI